MPAHFWSIAAWQTAGTEILPVHRTSPSHGSYKCSQTVIYDNILKWQQWELSAPREGSAHSKLQWRHNGRHGVSNHRPHGCLLNRLFRRRSKKPSKLRVTGLCAGNSPGTGEFPAQMASNAENVSIWWRHHEKQMPLLTHFEKHFIDTEHLYSSIMHWKKS